jgi:glycosyltransferase involved in cell wall biosynthesis
VHAMEVDISIVIPAYNEKERLQKTLAEYCHLSEKLNCNTEIIVVIDGLDETSKIVEEYARKYKGMIKCLKFGDRLGKGGALMRGFTSAKGKLVGFTDADGSTKIDDFIKLVETMKNDGECDGVIGSRWVKGAEFIKKPSTSRIFASRGLNVLVRGFLRLNFRDTQCGAKVFKKEMIEKCFPYINISGFSFDIYLLYAAVKMGFKIKEVPLRWEYTDGSKIKFSDILRIFLDVCMLKKNYLEASTFAR